VLIVEIALGIVLAVIILRLLPGIVAVAIVVGVIALIAIMALLIWFNFKPSPSMSARSELLASCTPFRFG